MGASEGSFGCRLTKRPVALRPHHFIALSRSSLGIDVQPAGPPGRTARRGRALGGALPRRLVPRAVGRPEPPARRLPRGGSVLRAERVPDDEHPPGTDPEL